MSYLPSRLLTSSSRHFCLTKDSPITGIWITKIRGHIYELDHQGRLRPQRKDQPMAPSITTASIVEDVKRDLLAPPIPTIDLIVSEELHALALRREAHRRAQENR